ncbi:Fusaric acid cluster transcription factor FUB12 [Pleurostoma richardsiae]|uniref:Fusaric acid cluster transcription factor FUB12 n=1 Tax=Pleurostoma richardsiae TaxID=41990 RepID=A0AA38VHN0_9PEZI|nr:Fusaric acid cluster transcription factor FUB12 [Pleurostoma richardsiae]
MGNGVPSPDKILDATNPGRDLVEYHNGLNYLSILGEVGLDAGRAELSGLDLTDREYLTKKGVFNFPPRDSIAIFLKCYFEFVHPYLPVFNRVEFMQSYESGQYSAFLMQAILAIAALYAPAEALQSCGFTERSTAQASFFSKAAILYDFRCERSQLRMLQGSLILSSTVFSYSLDKDFRYWFHNAVRIAVKMGLHKSDIVHDMDPTTYKLCKRIWWVIYSRDVLLSFMGHQNMRMLTNNICDTPPVTEDDWDEETIPARFEPLLPALTRQEKLYFIANCNLAVIASRCLSTFKDRRENCLDDLARAFESWRNSLPHVLQLNECQPAGEAIWHTVLLATSYRFECIIYRLLRIWWQTKDPDRHWWAKKRLAAAMFELDTIIRRVVANGVLHKFPLSFKSCVPAVLALYIEVALDDSESDLTRSMARMHIIQGMLLLKQLQEFPSIQRALLAFDWVLTQKDLLSATPPPELPPNAPSLPRGGFLSDPDEKPATEQDSTAFNSTTPDLFGESGQWFEEFLGFDFLDNLELTSL